MSMRLSLRFAEPNWACQCDYAFLSSGLRDFELQYEQLSNPGHSMCPVLQIKCCYDLSFPITIIPVSPNIYQLNLSLFQLLYPQLVILPNHG